MPAAIQKFTSSFAIAIVVIALLAAITSIPGCSFVSVLLLPGVFISALIFPEGIHSHHGNVFLLLSGIVDALILTWPIPWMRRQRRKGMV